MKQPKGFDPIAWARYNEWRSGARNSVSPASEYADVKVESAAADRLWQDEQLAQVTGLVARRANPL